MIYALEGIAKLEKNAKFNDTKRLHARVKKEFTVYCNSHEKKMIEVNEVKLLKCTDFEGFISQLIKRLNSLGYFRKYQNLEHDLIKAKGLFPIKLAKSFQKSTLYLDFIFKNQRGVHSDDLDIIFMILEVETYNHAVLVRGFTMLFDENQSSIA